MSDAFEEQAWVRLGVATALLKQYAADQRLFLEEIASLLERTLPGEAEVMRRGGLFSKKSVHKIEIFLSDNRYSLEDTGRGPLRSTVTHIVRGIALKTEEIPVEEWLDAIGEALEVRVQSNATARDALARFIK